MQNHRDPTRRNRNIGTAKQGHGEDNRDRISRRWRDAIWGWGRGVPSSRVSRIVWGRELPFLVEHTRSDAVHACTVDDIASMLNLLPKRHINDLKDIAGIRGVVLRQPTRKEERLSPAWAQIDYFQKVNGDYGPVVFLDAQVCPLTRCWDRHLRPDDQREFDRLAAAADRVEQTKRGHTFTFDLAGVRRIQLYHSLPHEIGHWADMFEKVEFPALDDFDRWEGLLDRYFERPVDEREEYAHRYADKARAALEASGDIPFERKLDIEALKAEGLRPEDFCRPTTA